MSEFKRWLIERFKIERKRFDRTGVYAYTQRAMAYNSNKIEGSTLTPEQTASLFDNGTLPVNDDYYRAKDVEEMNGHFLMFNHMLDTLEEELTENLIKRMHYELKSGVFEDRANGYAIGDYKKRPNMIGMYKTALPKDVEAEMRQLLDWYHKQEKTMKTLAEFHATEHAVLVSTLKNDNTMWVYYMLKLMDLYRYHTGAAQPGLAVKKLNTIDVIVADINLQNQFAAFVHQINKSKFEVQKSLEKTQLLYDSLMQEYFG